MCFAKSRPLGLRTRLTLWTSLVLAVSLAAGFAWVHHGLRKVLEARNDAFLERKATELLAGVADHRPERTSVLVAEIEREVAAYEAEGLIVVVRDGPRISVAPGTDAARRLADQPVPPGPPRTLDLIDSNAPLRVLHAPSEQVGLSLQLGISLAETEATLAEFARNVAGGSLVFLVVAVAGGLFLSRQALRPVAESIRTARRLDPANLSERLPRTGANDELDELAGTINGLLDRLAAYHAQVIRFTADASHELRSPLAAMRAAVEVALQRPREIHEYRNVLASLGEQCERLTSLVNGLLLLARADAGEIPLCAKALDLTALAEEVAEMFEFLAEEREIQLVTETTGPVSVLGDRSRLWQLVTNLLDNAIRFTEPSGSVTLRVEAVGDRALLRVQDTGKGIAPDHLPHVFERFYQEDAARTSGGCGLGLSICHWIVKAHGGTIEAESRDGQGTAFMVALPLMPAGAPLVSTETSKTC
ncbi:heavy metal sensor kinase [Singulisphaera sp. GP187]|uniref:sensor histidine kinase n=1 Tax=Singulisphaera sp. GP187 TaxID=1882752 RepID=UPI00092B5C52|nr:ATP-binding protein [Singulisphaera sp. GP187]SIO34774.1 heavy metal sensor kinase [Singulisphaera sp. GP187]